MRLAQCTSCFPLVFAILTTASFFAHELRAERIDFESGFTDQQTVDFINTPGNVVEVFVGSPGSREQAFIAEVGGAVTGFIPNDGSSLTSEIGSYFLTDGTDTPAVGSSTFSYFFQFEKAISYFEIALLDFQDGLPVGTPAVVTATAYSDGFVNQVATNSIAISQSSPDPSVFSLSVGDGTTLFTSVEIANSIEDSGTGVDNIEFVTVPEPSSMMIGICFGIYLATCRRKRAYGL